MDTIKGIKDWRLSTELEDYDLQEKISTILNDTTAYRELTTLFKKEGLPPCEISVMAYHIEEAIVEIFKDRISKVIWETLSE